jgi:hypothetical protein
MLCRKNADRHQPRPCQAVACGACSSYMCNPIIEHLDCIVSMPQNPDEQKRLLSVDCLGLDGLGTKTLLCAIGQPTPGYCSGLHAGLSSSPRFDCICLVRLPVSPNDYGDKFVCLAEWFRTWQDWRQSRHLALRTVDVLGVQMGARLVGGCA